MHRCSISARSFQDRCGAFRLAETLTKTSGKPEVEHATPQVRWQAETRSVNPPTVLFQLPASAGTLTANGAVLPLSGLPRMAWHVSRKSTVGGLTLRVSA